MQIRGGAFCVLVCLLPARPRACADWSLVNQNPKQQMPCTHACVQVIVIGVCWPRLCPAAGAKVTTTTKRRMGRGLARSGAWPWSVPCAPGYEAIGTTFPINLVASEGIGTTFPINLVASEGIGTTFPINLVASEGIGTTFPINLVASEGIGTTFPINLVASEGIGTTFPINLVASPRPNGSIQQQCFVPSHTYTRTHIHTQTYIYIYIFKYEYTCTSCMYSHSHRVSRGLRCAWLGNVGWWSLCPERRAGSIGSEPET